MDFLPAYIRVRINIIRENAATIRPHTISPSDRLVPLYDASNSPTTNKFAHDMRNMLDNSSRLTFTISGGDTISSPHLGHFMSV